MTVIAIANLGTHDLVDCKEIEHNKKYPSPSLTKYIIEQPETWAFFDLPILKPFLEHVGDYTGEKPLLLLIVSQQKKADQEMKNKDTIFLGRLIKKFLEKGGPNNYRNLVSAVNLSSPITTEPHNHDKMLDWYKANLSSCLAKMIEKDSAKKDNRLHISITAGTPAMNVALLFSSFNLESGFVEKVWHINESRQKAEALDIGHVLTGEPFRRVYNSHIDRGDYIGAAVHLDIAAPVGVISILYALADIRTCDFSGAIQKLKNINMDQALPRIAEATIKLIKFCELLYLGQKELELNRRLNVSEGVNAVISDLIFLLELQFKRRDYPEALATLFRLQETLVRIHFEKVTNLTAGDLFFLITKRKTWVNDLKKLLGDKSKEVNLNNIKTNTLRKTIIVLDDKHPMSSWLNRLYALDPKVPGKKILNLRNECRVAHGFANINDQIIKQTGWPGGWPEILKSSQDTANSILGQIDAPPYDEIQENLREVLFSR